MQPGAGRGRQDRLFLLEVTIRSSSGLEIKDYQRGSEARSLTAFDGNKLIKKRKSFCILRDRM